MPGFGEVATDSLSDWGEVEGIETHHHRLAQVCKITGPCGVALNVVNGVGGAHVVGVDHKERTLFLGARQEFFVAIAVDQLKPDDFQVCIEHREHQPAVFCLPQTMVLNALANQISVGFTGLFVGIP